MNLSEMYAKKYIPKVSPENTELINSIFFDFNLGISVDEPKQVATGTVTCDQRTGNLYVYNGSAWLQIASQPAGVSSWRI